MINAPATIPPGDLCQEPRDREHARDGSSMQEVMVDLDLCLHLGDSECRIKEQPDCSTALPVPSVPNRNVTRELHNQKQNNNNNNLHLLLLIILSDLEEPTGSWVSIPICSEESLVDAPSRPCPYNRANGRTRDKTE